MDTYNASGGGGVYDKAFLDTGGGPDVGSICILHQRGVGCWIQFLSTSWGVWDVGSSAILHFTPGCVWDVGSNAILYLPPPGRRIDFHPGVWDVGSILLLHLTPDDVGSISILRHGVCGM